MAVGDAVVNWSEVTSNGTVDVRPGSAVEWLIHTVMSQSGKSMEIYLTDPGSPTAFTLVDTLVGGSVHGLTFRLTNSYWMRLKNVSGGVAYLGYSGVVTNE